MFWNFIRNFIINIKHFGYNFTDDLILDYFVNAFLNLLVNFLDVLINKDCLYFKFKLPSRIYNIPLVNDSYHL